MAEELTLVKPIQHQLYVIRLSSGETWVGEVTTVDLDDHKVTFQLDKNTTKTMILTEDRLDLQLNEIVDIERVIRFDISILDNDEEQLTKLLTSDIIQDLDISLDEIKDKDMKYTSTELKEDILSQLIFSFDAYDKYSLVKSLTDISNELYSLSKLSIQPYRYNIIQGKSFPRWLIPYVDNPLFKTESETLETGTYLSRIQHLLDTSRPIQPSLSEFGYTTSDHTLNYLSDSSVAYDMRKNTCHLIQRFDAESTLVHQADRLNITGLLYLPASLSYASIHIPTLHMSYREKGYLFDILTQRPYTTLQTVSAVRKEIKLDNSENNLLEPISYRIPKRVEQAEFYEMIDTIIPSIQQLVETLPEEIQSKIMNYHDLVCLFSVYNMDIYSLKKEDRVFVNQLIKSNIRRVVTQPSMRKLVVEPPSMKQLSIEDKVHKLLTSILNVSHIPTRNEYLQTYIQKFTRPARSGEDLLNLYNLYTNQADLCKHYQYSSIYHKDRHAYETMMTIYGGVPIDGSIYCKHCGEYLCNEDFSQFEGFSDERPILLREQIVQEVNLLESYKETDILMVKQVGTLFDTKLTDIDCQLVLDLIKTIDHNKIANLRYNTLNVTTSDEHPLIKQKIKEMAKLDPKEKRKQQSKLIKSFQSYLVSCNQLVMIIAGVMIVIQTAIPAYTFKNRNDFSLFQFDKSVSLSSIYFQTKVINQCLSKLSSYETKDKVWSHFKSLLREHKTYPTPLVKQQVISVMKLLLGSSYPLITSRVETYLQFVRLSSYKYVRYEWALYKPLLKSEIYQTANQVLQDKHEETKENYILDYNSYPVENVSLLEPLQQTDKPMFVLAGLKPSDIMTNQAFLRLFRLTVSNYGIHKSVSPRLDLTIDRMLTTLADPEPVQAIFQKHKWSSSEKSGQVMYSKLRTHIVPDIIQHYLKVKSTIETCYDDHTMCNEFIHTHLNNYDLTMFRTPAKRQYSYKPFQVYPDKSYEDLTQEFKDKLFGRYCYDPNHQVIRKRLTLDYLGDMMLLAEADIEEDSYSTIEISMKADQTNFKVVMKDIFRALPMYPFVVSNPLDYDIYKEQIVDSRSPTESRYVDVLTRNKIVDTKDTLLILLENAIDKPVPIRELEDAFNLDTLPYLAQLSQLISSCENTKQRKRFENIFLFTSSTINLSPEERNELERDGYRHKNHRESDIEAIFQMFTGSDKMSPSQIRNYLTYFQTRLAELSGTYKDKRVPKYWGLTDNSIERYNEYLSMNRSCLHKDLFSRDPIYKGYHQYKDTGMFECLVSLIEDTMIDLDHLKIHPQSQLPSYVEKLIHLYVFYRFFGILIGFYEKISQQDPDALEKLQQYTTRHRSEVEYDLQMFLMDLVIDMFEIHYDTRWVVSNSNADDLKMRLSKQKEKEKQQLIQKLDTMSDEKRATTMELQKIGLLSMYHDAIQMNEERIIDEYSRINEGDDEILDKEIVDAALNVGTGELNEPEVIPQVIIDEDAEQGYYNPDEIDEDGQIGDEYHEFHDEDQLDNNFNE